jgi:hypothetical protein
MRLIICLILPLISISRLLLIGRLVINGLRLRGLVSGLAISRRCIGCGIIA